MILQNVQNAFQERTAFACHTTGQSSSLFRPRSGLVPETLQDVFDRSSLGTSNWLLLLYALKGAVVLLGMLNWSSDAKTRTMRPKPKYQHWPVLPWVMTGLTVWVVNGIFPSSDGRNGKFDRFLFVTEQHNRVSKPTYSVAGSPNAAGFAAQANVRWASVRRANGVKKREHHNKGEALSLPVVCGTVVTTARYNF